MEKLPENEKLDKTDEQSDSQVFMKALFLSDTIQDLAQNELGAVKRFADYHDFSQTKEALLLAMHHLLAVRTAIDNDVQKLKNKK